MNSESISTMLMIFRLAYFESAKIAAIGSMYSLWYRPIASARTR